MDKRAEARIAPSAYLYRDSDAGLVALRLPDERREPEPWWEEIPLYSLPDLCAAIARATGQQEG